MKEIVIDAIYRAVDDFNLHISDKKKIVKSPDTVLLGQKGVLDSMEVVNFIVEVELKLEELLGTQLNLLEEEALEHFELLGTLIEYVSQNICKTKA